MTNNGGARDLVSALSALLGRIVDAITAIGRGNYQDAADALEAGADDLRSTLADLRSDA